MKVYIVEFGFGYQYDGGSIINGFKNPEDAEKLCIEHMEAKCKYWNENILPKRIARRDEDEPLASYEIYEHPGYYKFWLSTIYEYACIKELEIK